MNSLETIQRVHKELKSKIDLERLSELDIATYTTVIASLEKQIPIKVSNKVINKQEASGFDETCPSCGTFVFYDYCHNCGQKLDWN